MEEEITNVEKNVPEQSAESKWYETVSYEDAKVFIKSNIISAARSFMAIGYYLKLVRNKEMYKQDGHETIWDFAQAEYSISKSTASRYMTMNDRFSKMGNSPVVKDEFRDYSKSQLQEMLSLTDEQLEQVQPADRVEDIRSMRKPKEIPYVHIPGQVELTDFPGVAPEDVSAAAQVRNEMASRQPVKQSYNIPVEDLLPDAADSEPPVIAISQQVSESKAEPASVPVPESQAAEPTENPGSELDENAGCPPNSSFCLRQEWGQSPEEQEAGHKECRKCWADWKRAHKVLDKTDTAQMQQEVMDEAPESDMEPDAREDVIDGEFREIQDPDEDSEEVPTDLQIAQDELARAKKLLNKVIGGVDENDIHIRQLKIKVCALASYVCDLDDIMNPPPKPEQPELPELKNNDQRKEWLKNYHSWGIWYRDENIGVSYYKYDFDNGARLIAEEYQSSNEYTGEYTSSYLHLVGGPEPERHPTGGYGKWQRNERYNRYANSETELVEFLKASQKKG